MQPCPKCNSLHRTEREARACATEAMNEYTLWIISFQASCGNLPEDSLKIYEKCKAEYNTMKEYMIQFVVEEKK